LFQKGTAKYSGAPRGLPAKGEARAHPSKPASERRTARPRGRVADGKGLTGDDLCDFIEELGPMPAAARITEEAIADQPPLEPTVRA